MKRVFQRITISFLLTIFGVGFVAGPVLATVDQAALNSYYNGIVVPKAANEVNNPQIAGNADLSESIDPSSGSLRLRQTDIALPGRDGLDLVLGTMYNSSDAYCSSKKANLEYVNRQYQTYERWYAKVTVWNYSTSAWEVWASNAYEDEVEATIVADNTKKALQANQYPGYAFFFYQITHEGNLVTKNNWQWRIMSSIDSKTYLKTRYDLGAGWSFSLPSVQIETTDPPHKYFHDGSGACYEIILSSDPNSSNLADYQSKNARFQEDNGGYTNGQVASRYVFINAEKQKTYFGEDGRLLGIKDRFGNEIKFTHTNRTVHGITSPYITQIVDSIGRTINIDYLNSTSDGTCQEIAVTIHEPNNQSSRTYRYQKARFTYSAISYTGERTERNETVLWKVIDPRGKIARWNEYKYVTGGFNFGSQWDSYGKARDTAIVVTSVRSGYNHMEWQTSFETDQQVRGLGPTGFMEETRYLKREDIHNQINGSKWQPLYRYNTINYNYWEDCSGFPDTDAKKPDTWEYSSISVNADGMQTVSVFNKKHQMIRRQSDLPPKK